jgi:spermidine synthase
MPGLKRSVPSRLSSVEISEFQGVRVLHLGGDAVQSAMRLSDPDALELHYTRAMMGFALLAPAPEAVLLIGLGGGSLARFIHRHLARTRVCAVEVNPKVLNAARMWFGLPEDDARLQVIIGDGAEHVPAHPSSADVLLLDAFDDGQTVRALATPSYYRQCFQALRARGLLVQNFIIGEPRLETYLKRLQEVFAGALLRLPAANRVNLIALALKGFALPLQAAVLERQAAVLEKQLGLPYRKMVRSLIQENPDPRLIAR